MPRRREHWALCDDCAIPVRPCGCDEHTVDHFVAEAAKFGGTFRRVGLLCGQCEYERDQKKPGFKL